MYKWIVLLCAAPVWAAPSDYNIVVNDLLDGTSRQRVAVAEINYADGRESGDAGVLAARVSLALTNYGQVLVIERAKIAQVFEELKFQSSGAVEVTTEMGQMLGADLLVLGTLTELPRRQIELNLRLVSVKTSAVLRATTTVITKDWVTPPPPRDETAPVSLGQVEPKAAIAKLPPGGADVLLAPLKPKARDPITGAVFIGSGCGFDIYYEGDGSFMRWSRGKPHGIGGSGTYIKREDNQYCNYVVYITQRIRYKHPELRDLWAQYRRDNGF